MTNPAPTPAPPPAPTSDDEFAAAFSELSAPQAQPAPEAAEPAATAPPPGAETKPQSKPQSKPEAGFSEATGGVSAAVPGEPAASGDTAPATPADTAAANSATADQPAATPSEPAPAGYVSQDQFAALQAELSALKKQAAPAESARPEPAPLYTPDEQGVIDGYLKEWPDVAKGEALMRRAEYSQLIKYVFDQFAPRLEALETSQTSTSTRTQYQDIVSLVPDYDSVRDATLAWIETQPGYLKSAYQKVAEDGSPQDVADLITRFKKETGHGAKRDGAAPAGAPAGGAQAGAAQTAGASAGAVPASLPAAAQAAAAALKPVKTTRSEPVSSPDPNDFDAAFKEFASAS
jgi:hypothetical protein